MFAKHIEIPNFVMISEDETNDQKETRGKQKRRKSTTRNVSKHSFSGRFQFKREDRGFFLFPSLLFKGHALKIKGHA